MGGRAENVNLVVCRSVNRGKLAETRGDERVEGVSPSCFRAPQRVHLFVLWPLWAPGGRQHPRGVGRCVGGPEPRRKSMVKPSTSSCLRGRTRFSVCHLPSFQDKESMRQVMQAVDKANGYSFGDQEHRSLEALMSAAVGADFHFASYPSRPILCCVEFLFVLPWGREAGGGAGSLQAQVVTNII